MPRTGSKYIDGTWVPTIFGSVTPGTQSYGAGTFGWYARNGNLVTYGFRVEVTALDEATVGAVNIGGLPFPSGSLFLAGGALDEVSNVPHAANKLQFGIRALPAKPALTLVEFGQATGGAVAPVDCATQLTNTSIICGTGSYLLR